MVMQTQQQWEEIWESALLGMRSQVYTCIHWVFALIRMLFNIDPVLPFEMADKLKHSKLCESTENDCNESSEIASSSSSDLIHMVQKIRTPEARNIRKCKTKNKNSPTISS